MFRKHGQQKCVQCNLITGSNNLARHMRRKHPTLQPPSTRRDGHMVSDQLYSINAVDRPRVNFLAQTSENLYDKYRNDMSKYV